VKATYSTGLCYARTDEGERHLWVDLDYPREDGTTPQFCPRCDAHREKPRGTDD
jgi:hypothetical protein